MGMRKSRTAALRGLLPLAVTAAALASCGHSPPAALAPAHATSPATSPAGRHQATARRAGNTSRSGQQVAGPLPAPAGLAPSGSPTAAGEGTWSPAGWASSPASSSWTYRSSARISTGLARRSRPMVEELASDWVAEQKLPNPWVG